MAFVVDASVAISWLIDAERTLECDALLDRATIEGIVAPSILVYELSNRIGRARGTGELTPDQTGELIRMFTALDLEVSQPTTSMLIERVAASGLTAYDAAYLEVAAVRGIPLATLDRRLREAARVLGVTVLPSDG